jgi:hypothetical protein
LGLNAAEFDILLPDIDVINVASERSTQMRNVYEEGRRRQQMPQRAARIGAQHLPDDWRRAPIVLLGPVAGELDDALASCFTDSLVGAGAQGWLRHTGTGARVQPIPPERWNDEPVLRCVRALFVSDEDVPADKANAALQRWCGIVETVAFTRGYDGADVCHKSEWRHVDAFPVKAVDPTGAGDIFAAAFLIRLHETGDAWEAARFASCAASFVVEGEGVAAIPHRKMVEQRLQEHPEIVAR